MHRCPVIWGNRKRELRTQRMPGLAYCASLSARRITERMPGLTYCASLSVRRITERMPGLTGKFAAVRRARHRATGRVFAAKFVRRRRRAKTSEAEAEARHEVAVLVLGRAHKHIVHMHSVYLTRQEYIILLEL
ncbi:hypothetical protein HAZT_HAZT008416 [Hyalella azteca]|uniref:Protein kinase domain-containing protein n=1 Tax=Hyalella azteca TaxID=294128 RepID=A0A6A0GZM8_HYAAZ|nr:hypothetical protein HAZT_HAZT008416 [Hyalella azteca]